MGNSIICLIYQVSIRSPHRSEGRLSLSGSISLLFFVSIRSPHRSEGRHNRILSKKLTTMFQSAPLTEARGDFGNASVSPSM